MQHVANKKNRMRLSRNDHQNAPATAKFPVLSAYPTRPILRILDAAQQIAQANGLERSGQPHNGKGKLRVKLNHQNRTTE
jgi:hypothetical protein